MLFSFETCYFDGSEGSTVPTHLFGEAAQWQREGSGGAEKHQRQVKVGVAVWAEHDCDVGTQARWQWGVWCELVLDVGVGRAQRLPSERWQTDTDRQTDIHTNRQTDRQTDR